VTAANYMPGQYWDLGGAAIPAGTVGTAKLPWTAAERNTATAIDWTVEGNTYFQYAVSIAGCAGAPAAAQAGVCYAVGAQADIDGDGTPGVVALVKQNLAGTVTPTAVPFAAGWPTAGGSCLGPLYATVCTDTGPDVF
jgi:hypothetical protein